MRRREGATASFAKKLVRVSARPHACGVVSNDCCDASIPRGTVFEVSAAPPLPPAEKGTASKDQAGQASTGNGAGTAAASGGSMPAMPWPSRNEKFTAVIGPGIARDRDHRSTALTAYKAGSDFWLRRVLRCFFARGQSPL